MKGLFYPTYFPVSTAVVSSGWKPLYNPSLPLHIRNMKSRFSVCCKTSSQQIVVIPNLFSNSSPRSIADAVTGPERLGRLTGGWLVYIGWGRMVELRSDRSGSSWKQWLFGFPTAVISLNHQPFGIAVAKPMDWCIISVNQLMLALKLWGRV